MTRLSIHKEKWRPDRLWQQACYRWRVRLLAHSEGVRRWILRRQASGDDPDGPPPQVLVYWNKAVEPGISYREDGTMTCKWALREYLEDIEPAPQ